MKISINTNIFNPIYRNAATDYKHRHEVYFGSAGSGKSHFIAQKLLIKALTSRRKILILRKVDKTSKDSTWSLMREMIDQFQLTELVEFRLAEMRIVFPNESEMLFRGLQDQERIKSITGISDAWLEEASEFTAEDANQIDLRIRSMVPHQQIFYSYNPVSKSNWVYDRWHKEGVKIPKDTTVLHTTYHDNMFLPQSYRDSMENLKDRDPFMYRVYALGEFASMGKRVYTNWETRFIMPEELATTTAYFGLDFGFTNDPTTLIRADVDEKKKIIYITDEFLQKGMLNNTIADMIKAKGYSKEVITADSAEQKSIVEIRRAGIERIRAAKKGPDSVSFGIKKVQQFDIVVSPECEQTIIELENYVWQKDKKSGEYIDKPVDNHNHLLDALRYALEDIGKPPNTARVMSKSLLGL